MCYRTGNGIVGWPIDDCLLILEITRKKSYGQLLWSDYRFTFVPLSVSSLLYTLNFLVHPIFTTPQGSAFFTNTRYPQITGDLPSNGLSLGLFSSPMTHLHNNFRRLRIISHGQIISTFSFLIYLHSYLMQIMKSPTSIRLLFLSEITRLWPSLFPSHFYRHCTHLSFCIFTLSSRG